MQLINFPKLFLLLLVSSMFFYSCSEDPIFDPEEAEIVEEVTPVADLAEAGYDIIDLSTPTTAGTRSGTCEIEICATFTGTGRYAVNLPNGTDIFVNLNAQTVTINGVVFPLINNQLCETIVVNGSATATLGFKGAGSVVVTATSNGTSNVVFEAGVGISTVVLVREDVTLTCPHVSGTCEVEICANFTGTGRYAVNLPNGTDIFVNLNAQTVTINGVVFPLINNQLCQTIVLSGPTTATLGFKGAGSVVVTATYPDGTVCPVFDAGLGTLNVVLKREDVTLSCDPC